MIQDDIFWLERLSLIYILTLCPGTWLADLNKFHSGNLSAHGIDLCENIFRKNLFLDLRAHDIRKPFPESWGWKNTFDLVHQRWLNCGIQQSEWQTVVHNLVDAVKPDGHIQIAEAEWVLGHVPGDCSPTWASKSAGLDAHIESKVKGLLRNEGIKDIEIQTFDLGYVVLAKNKEDIMWLAELLLESIPSLALHREGKFIK